MKKSLLALAVAAFAATSASATTIYEKDGTSFGVDGRIQALYMNGAAGTNNGNKDSTIQNSARFGIQGRTQLTDGIAAFAYSQWDMADSSNENSGKKGNKIEARDQFVGVDFGQFGVVTAGRMKSTLNYVTGLTDVYDDWGCNAQFANDERNSGRLQYTWTGYGFTANVGYLSASNGYDFDNGFTKSAAVESGFNVSAGYTTVPVVFGPISIRAGYEYISGQDDRNNATNSRFTKLDDVKTWAVGLSWGTTDVGPYVAVIYNSRIMTFVNDPIDYKTTGYEFAVGYTFENGVTLRTGYDYAKYDWDTDDAALKSIPVYANYKINPNFNVWAEARFDVSSDDDFDTLANSTATYKADTTYSNDSAVVTVGARYSF